MKLTLKQSKKRITTIWAEGNDPVIVERTYWQSKSYTYQIHNRVDYWSETLGDDLIIDYYSTQGTGESTLPKNWTMTW